MKYDMKNIKLTDSEKAMFEQLLWYMLDGSFRQMKENLSQASPEKAMYIAVDNVKNQLDAPIQRWIDSKYNNGSVERDSD